jgi:hypothetical protein
MRRFRIKEYGGLDGSGTNAACARGAPRQVQMAPRASTANRRLATSPYGICHPAERPLGLISKWPAARTICSGLYPSRQTWIIVRRVFVTTKTILIHGVLKGRRIELSLQHPGSPRQIVGGSAGGHPAQPATNVSCAERPEGNILHCAVTENRPLVREGSVGGSYFCARPCFLRASG